MKFYFRYSIIVSSDPRLDLRLILLIVSYNEFFSSFNLFRSMFKGKFSLLKKILE